MTPTLEEVLANERKVLAEFFWMCRAHYRGGGAKPLVEYVRRMIDDPMLFAAAQDRANAPSTVGHPEAKPVGEGGVHGLGKGMGDDRDPSGLQGGD